MSACLGVNASSRAEPRHAYHGFSSAHLTQVRVNAACKYGYMGSSSHAYSSASRLILMYYSYLRIFSCIYDVVRTVSSHVSSLQERNSHVAMGAGDFP